MTTTVIVHIAPDAADPTRCGSSCGERVRGSVLSPAPCSRGWQIYGTRSIRGPRCLRAEKLLADLRAAGNVLHGRDCIDYSDTPLEQWEAAIDAIKEETS